MFNRPMWTPLYSDFIRGSGFMPGGLGSGIGNSLGRGIGASALGSTSRLGGLKSLTKGINWSGMFSGVQKTLNIVNQTIPIVKQAKPMFNNMKTMLKLADAFKNETDSSPKKEATKKETNNVIEKESTTSSTDNKPNFFL